jgi:hypothetical protein
MVVVESLSRHACRDKLKYNYIYRMTKNNLLIRIEETVSEIQSYGIEIERQDIEDGRIVNIERDCVKSISPQRYKVHELLKLLYNNEVSPIHLIDILGEYIDKYIIDFDEVLKDTSTY